MTEKDSAVLAVEQIIDALDQGDVNAALAGFATDILILDDIAPFRRTGLGEAKAWIQEVIGARKRLHASLNMEDRTRRNEGEGRIYMVARAHLTITSSSGIAEEGGLLTFTLREVDGSWLVDTFVWSVPS